LSVKRLTLLALALMLFTRCGPEKVKEATQPDWVLPRDSMIALMTDIHLVEGSRTGASTLGDTVPVDLYFKKVWEKHGITKAIYDSNFNYYVQNAKEMNAVYEKVLERLSKLEAQVKTAPKKPAPVADSVKARLDSLRQRPTP
jgi:hypothetical protein